MNGNWIKISRKLLEWEWYDTPHMVKFFMHCLLKANYQEKQWRGHTIKRGSFVTSYANLSEETKLSVKSVRTCINRLKSTGEMAIKTTNKFSVLTIVKYDDYQNNNEEGAIKTAGQEANKGQTKGKQRATTKEIKEIKEIKEEKKNIPAIEEFLKYAREILNGEFKQYEKALRFKYLAWKENDWHTGGEKPRKIKNWKTTLLNTFPHMKKQKTKPKEISA